VRKAAGLTQKELAKRIGVNEVTIQKIENGGITMSRQLAYRLNNQLGCGIRTTRQDADGQVKWDVSDKMLGDDDSWTPYTREHFLAHKEARADFANDLDVWSEALATALHLLLRGAARAGTFPALVSDVEETLADWYHKYQLEARVRGMLLDDEIDAEVVARVADLLEVRPAEAGSQFKLRRRMELKAAWEAEKAAAKEEAEAESMRQAASMTPKSSKPGKKTSPSVRKKPGPPVATTSNKSAR
jgi:transcriptional regulator with XRE-family HTH domain